MNSVQNLIFSKRGYLLIISLFVLYTISGYLTYIFSPELSQLFGFKNLNTIFNNQLLSFFVGVIIVFILSHLDKDIWFNRLGATIFTVSLFLLIVMLFVPSSFTPYIDKRRLFLVIGSISINPMLFFSIGSLWLISWVESTKKNIKITNLTIVALMLITAFFSLNFNDFSMLLMLEIVFLSISFYLNGINKFTVFGLIASLGLGIAFILNSAHRIHRIKMWLESSISMIDLYIKNALHENILISLMNTTGKLSLLFVVSLYMFIIYLIFTANYKNKNYKLFAVGVGFVLVVSLLLNILYISHLSPIYPSPLYFFGYGNSVVIASFIMMGILLMIMKKNDDIQKNMKLKLVILVSVSLLLIIGSQSTKYAKNIIHIPTIRSSIITDDNITIAYSQEAYKLKLLNNCFNENEITILLDKISTIVPVMKKQRKNFYFKKVYKDAMYKTVAYGVSRDKIKKLRVIIDEFLVEHKFKAKKRYYKFILSGESRVYPHTDFLTPVIGYIQKKQHNNFTYTKGIKGIENFYDFTLTSQNSVSKDVHLNINYALQNKLEKELTSKKSEMNVHEIVSIVLDPNTFNIKAMASSNRFNSKHIRRTDFNSLNVSAVESLFSISHYIEPIKKAIEAEDNLTLEEGYKKFGFYKKSGIDLNYEHVSIDSFDVNLVQLLKMYAVFYSDGKIANPTIAKQDTPKSLKQIISKENAHKIKKYLENSLDEMQYKPIIFKDTEKTGYIKIKEIEVDSKKYLQIFLKTAFQVTEIS